MLEPIKVDHPTFFPNACVQCGGQTGPLVDTHVEDREGRRVYACVSCVRRDAIALGLLEGVEHDRLLEVVAHDAEARRELEQMTEQRDQHAADAADLAGRLEEANEKLAWRQQRIDQLEQTIEDRARAELALVTHSDEAA